MSSASATNGSLRSISPVKLSHAVFRTTRLREMVEWYRTVLNAEVMYENDFLVFMTYDEEHHRIAFVQAPGLIEKPKRSTGLDHLAFFYASFGDWIETYERLKAAGIIPRAPIHHGLSMSLYYRDPDDNGVELSIDNVEKAHWHDWMRHSLAQNGPGLPFDPDELARKYHSGVPEAELRRFEGSSRFDPEMLRRMLD
jgi:catechol-2,3-dioxygenase